VVMSIIHLFHVTRYVIYIYIYICVRVSYNIKFSNDSFFPPF